MFTFHGENGKLETCAVPRTWAMAQRRKIIICGYGLTGTGKAFWKKVATKILTSCEFGRDYFTCLRESGGLMSIKIFPLIYTFLYSLQAT